MQAIGCCMPAAFLLLLAFVLLAVGTITDFKFREVPDWVNYSAIFAGIGLRLLYSASSYDTSFITEGLTGFGLFFVIGMTMFYLGQWGGGDSKILMALGAILGLNFSFVSFAAAFLINMLFVSAFYGLAWTLLLAFKHKKQFSSKFRKIAKNYVMASHVSLACAIVIAVLSLFYTEPERILLLFLAVFAGSIFYIFLFVKS